MPPIPTMPILSHHHHHEQHRQQQQQQHQRHHQSNPPPQPPHQRNPSAAAATCVTPTVFPTHAAAAQADSIASHDPPDLLGVPVPPAAAVAPGLPVMTGVPGIKIKNVLGFSCMFGFESVSMMELDERQV